jgi:Fur family peroxide stress response transcriptional regulator
MERTSKHFRKRDAILQCVRSTQVHPSAEWVYETVRAQIPDISLATVYRNLSLFKDQGLIVSLGTVNGIERFDGNTAPHVHFICTGCGAVVDLPEIQVPGELTSAAARASGGRVGSCQLTFTGLCNDCTQYQN